MGVGKGQVRRMKSTNSAPKAQAEEISRPKFNLGDKVKYNDKIKEPGMITSISYDKVKNAYCYGTSQRPKFRQGAAQNFFFGLHEEDTITLVDSVAPKKREKYLKNCLNKIVVYRYHPEVDAEAQYKKKLKQLDGQMARIVGVSNSPKEKFTLYFYEIDEFKNPGGGEQVYWVLDKKDFQSLEKVLKEQEKTREQHKEFIDEIVHTTLDF